MIHPRSTTPSSPHRPALTLALLAALAVGVATSDVPFAPLGKPLATVGALDQPRDAAFDSQGRLIIVDARKPLLIAINPDGTRDRRFTISRVARPPLNNAHAIVFDNFKGLLWVADTGNDRILAFDEAYAPRAQFGARGDEPGQFRSPQAIAVNETTVGVADTGNHRVQLFSREGEHQRSFGAWGFADGHLIRPTGICFDDEGNIYVADADRHDIQKFDEQGNLVLRWGDRGEHAGFFARPMKLAFHSGQIHVADSRNHRIEVFDTQGKLQSQWGNHALRPREGEGKFETPVSIAINWDASRAAVCEPVEQRVQLFTRFDEPEDAPRPLPPSGFSTHFAPFCAGARQTLVIPIPDLQAVDIYDTRRPVPIFITRLGSQGRRAGQFTNIAGVAYDPRHMEVAVSDSARRTISIFRLDRALDDEQKFYPDMAHLIREIDFAELRDVRDELRNKPVIVPGAIASTPDRGLFVADTTTGTIYHFDRRFRVRTILGIDEPFAAITAMRLASPEELLVADARERAIVALCPESGERLDFMSISNIDVLGFDVLDDQRLVVTDGAQRVSIVDRDGTAVLTWGAQGLGPGEFQLAAGVVAHTHEQISVIDWGNHRVQVFDDEGAFRDVIGSLQFVLPIKRATATRPAQPESND